MAPGMFVRVRLLAGETEPLLSIPQAALVQAPGFRQPENWVLVLDAENRVQRKRIVLRNSDWDTVVVESGLTEKDRVVPSDRGLKVGMVVTPKRELTVPSRSDLRGHSRILLAIGAPHFRIIPVARDPRR